MDDKGHYYIERDQPTGACRVQPTVPGPSGITSIIYSLNGLNYRNRRHKSIGTG